MNQKNLGVVIFCSLLLSSCGLIEKFKTPETASQSSENVSTTNVENTNTPSDDLFSTNNSEAQSLTENHTDAPNNITTNPTNEIASTTPADNQDELQALKNEFTGSGPNESQVAEVKAPLDSTPSTVAPASETEVAAMDTEAPKAPPTPVKTKNKIAKNKPAPLKIKEAAPEINTESEDAKVASSMTGEIKTYKVQKGETLMQIAFKLYGDISKWKDLKKLNGDKLASNTSLKSHLTLKYAEPETPFVWNPEGSPYMIKNGETLGIISNNVYHTPKKWKSIWENNKPLIKNPNVIYAGFTLYYKGAEMANYVQPKKEQPKIVKAKAITEEIKVENALSEIERLDAAEEIREIKSATVRAPASADEDDSVPDTSTPPAPIPDDASDDVSAE